MDLTRTALWVNRMASILFPYMMVVMNFTTLAIIWFGAKQLMPGNLASWSNDGSNAYVLQIMFSFIMISVIFIFLPRASVSAKRITEVLSVEPKVIDPKVLGKQITWFEDSKPTDIKGIVEFENVTFAYPGAKEPVLSEISFRAEPGKITAIIGSTGSGKTTLLNLIPRFYDVHLEV